MVAKATLPDQMVIDSPLSQLAATAREADVPAPAVVVIGEAVGYRAKLPGPAAHAIPATQGAFA